jgi:hypothetical protein
LAFLGIVGAAGYRMYRNGSLQRFADDAQRRASDLKDRMETRRYQHKADQAAAQVAEAVKSGAATVTSKIPASAVPS